MYYHGKIRLNFLNFNGLRNLEAQSQKTLDKYFPCQLNSKNTFVTARVFLFFVSRISVTMPVSLSGSVKRKYNNT